MATTMTRTRGGRTFGEGLEDDRPTSGQVGVEVPKGGLTVEQFNVFTHDATITISNPAKGTHRTFRVETLIGNWRKGDRMISVLSGPDNTNDYEGFAWVTETEVKVWWKKSSLGDDGKLTVWERYARMLENPGYFAKERGLKYDIMSKCRFCNHKLTTPKSIRNGYGPECAKKVGS